MREEKKKAHTKSAHFFFAPGGPVQAGCGGPEGEPATHGQGPGAGRTALKTSGSFLGATAGGVLAPGF